MSQASRQNAQTDVKKDFYKLVSNLNFGYDCRRNADNCFFQPIYDEIEDCPTQSTIKMFSTSKSLTLFQPRSLNVNWGGIFEQTICSWHAGWFYEARKNSLEIHKKELDAVFLMKKSRQKKKKHKKVLQRT